MKFYKKGLVFLLTTLFSAVFIFADYNKFGIPDSSEIRKEIQNEWFKQDLELIRLQNTQIRKNYSGQTFQISLEEKEDKFFVYVSPKSSMRIDVYDSTGVHTEVEDVYNINSFGTWMYARNKSDGSPDFIRIYVSKNSDVFIQFKSLKNTARIDFLVYGAYVVKSLPIGIPFEKLFSMSIQDIYNLTQKTIPWEYVDVNLDIYNNSKVMAQTIRSMLPKLAYEDDAMYDEIGSPISIRTGQPFVCDSKNKGKIVLSSCGFVKWVVDGLIEPMAGSYLKREPLVSPTVEYKDTGFQGALNSKFSTNFSLDWTRNLAAASLSVRAKKTYLYSETGVDVKVEPFAAIVTDKGVTNTVGYIKNTGYKPNHLKALLYSLSATEPGYFYLAAIRQTDRKKSEVKVFNDAAVIFPYLDENGYFKIVVFIDGQESKYSEFENQLKKTNDCFIHLVRVKASNVFYPQEKNLYAK